MIFGLLYGSKKKCVDEEKIIQEKLDNQQKECFKILLDSELKIFYKEQLEKIFNISGYQVVRLPNIEENFYKFLFSNKNNFNIIINNLYKYELLDTFLQSISNSKKFFFPVLFMNSNIIIPTLHNVGILSVFIDLITNKCNKISSISKLIFISNYYSTEFLNILMEYSQLDFFLSKITKSTKFAIEFLRYSTDVFLKKFIDCLEENDALSIFLDHLIGNDDNFIDLCNGLKQIQQIDLITIFSTSKFFDLFIEKVMSSSLKISNFLYSINYDNAKYITEDYLLKIIYISEQSQTLVVQQALHSYFKILLSEIYAFDKPNSPELIKFIHSKDPFIVWKQQLSKKNKYLLTSLFISVPILLTCGALLLIYYYPYRSYNQLILYNQQNRLKSFT